MDKKGFTLVEALLVIAIIGVLLLTLVPSVITIINKNKEKACISTRESILSSAKMFIAENKYVFDFPCGEGQEIYIEDLQYYGNIADNKDFEDKFLEEPVIVTYDCDNKVFSYEYNVDCES